MIKNKKSLYYVDLSDEDEAESYEGFCIDLLESLSKMLEFNYGKHVFYTENHYNIASNLFIK